MARTTWRPGGGHPLAAALVVAAWTLRVLPSASEGAEAGTGAAAPPPEAIVIVDAPAGMAPGLVASAEGAVAAVLGAAHLRVATSRLADGLASARGDAARRGLRDGIAAYDALRFEETIARLDATESDVVAGGAAGLTRAELADVFLYRALARHQLGDLARAWEDFVRSASYAPDRKLDPGRFPPAARDALSRAADAVSKTPRGALAIGGPTGARAFVDAADAGALPARVEGLLYGTHLVRVEAAGREVWVAVATLAAADLSVEARPEELPPHPGVDPPAELARFAARRGASLVVGIALAYAGPESYDVPALPAGERAEPAATVAIVAVRASEGAPAVDVRLRIAAATPAALAAAIGAALAPLSARARAATDPGTALAAPLPAPAVRRTPWLPWITGAALVVTGALAVTVGVLAASTRAAGDGVRAVGRRGP